MFLPFLIASLIDKVGKWADILALSFAEVSAAACNIIYVQTLRAAFLPESLPLERAEASRVKTPTKSTKNPSKNRQCLRLENEDSLQNVADASVRVVMGSTHTASEHDFRRGELQAVLVGDYLFAVSSALIAGCASQLRLSPLRKSHSRGFTLKTLTSSNEKPRRLSQVILAFGVFPLFLPFAITAFEGPES